MSIMSITKGSILGGVICNFIYESLASHLHVESKLDINLFYPNTQQGLKPIKRQQPYLRPTKKPNLPTANICLYRTEGPFTSQSLWSPFFPAKSNDAQA
jgi:hypothetical protein